MHIRAITTAFIYLLGSGVVYILALGTIGAGPTRLENVLAILQPPLYLLGRYAHEHYPSNILPAWWGRVYFTLPIVWSLFMGYVIAFVFFRPKKNFEQKQ